MAITHLGPRIKILNQSSKLFITQFPSSELLKQHLLPALHRSLPFPKPWPHSPGPTAPPRSWAEQLHPVRVGWGSSTFPASPVLGTAVRDAPPAAAIPQVSRARSAPPARSPGCSLTPAEDKQVPRSSSGSVPSPVAAKGCVCALCMCVCVSPEQEVSALSPSQPVCTCHSCCPRPTTPSSSTAGLLFIFQPFCRNS